MTDLKTAAQQALEALGSSLYPQPRQVAAIAALRAALAEPDIDPVDEYRKGFIDGQIDMRDRPEEPVQEPYCYVYEYDTALGMHRALYPKTYKES